MSRPLRDLMRRVGASLTLYAIEAAIVAALVLAAVTVAAAVLLIA